jgi:hypothetical protein
MMFAQGVVTLPAVTDAWWCYNLMEQFYFLHSSTSPDIHAPPNMRMASPQKLGSGNRTGHQLGVLTTEHLPERSFGRSREHADAVLRQTTTHAFPHTMCLCGSCKLSGQMLLFAHVRYLAPFFSLGEDWLALV